MKRIMLPKTKFSGIFYENNIFKPLYILNCVKVKKYYYIVLTSLSHKIQLKTFYIFNVCKKYMMLIKSYAIGFIYIVCVRAVSIIIFFSLRLKMLTQTPTKWYSLLEIPSRNVTGDTRVNPRSCLLNIYLFGVTEISEPWLLMLKYACLYVFLSFKWWF